MDALDELVGLFETEDAFDRSDEADEVFSKYTSTKPYPTKFDSKEKEQEQQRLTYRDLFGSPIKRKDKPVVRDENQDTEDLFPARNRNRSFPSSTTSFENDRKFTSSLPTSSFGANTATSQKSNFTYLPSSTSNVFLVDPNSKLRLVKHTISVYFDELTPVEKSLKERNLNTEFIPLGNWSMGASKNFWTTGVLVRKVGMRESSKGNTYSIWEINDFHNLELNWTVFLFGIAATSPTLGNIGVGSLVDLVNPKILDDTTASSKKGIKFSIYDSNQIRLIGRVHDFGYCEARKKDGSPCKIPVNTSICPVCIHHASGELRKSLRKSRTGKPKKTGFTKSNSNNFDQEQQLHSEWSRRKREGVITTDFSRSIAKPNSSVTASASKPTATLQNSVRISTRMELMDSSACVKRPSIQKGNHSSITFRLDNTTTLEMPKCDLAVQKKQEAKKALLIDPEKNRHLSEKDRKILEALGSGSEKEKPELSGLKINQKIMETDLASIVAKSTNAGARNVLEYLGSKTKAEEIKKKNAELTGSNSRGRIDGGPMIMTRETLSNMKAALNYVRQSGPIKKTDPNSVPGQTLRDSAKTGVKRKREEEDSKIEADNTKPRDADTQKPGSSKSLKTPNALQKKPGDLNPLKRIPDEKDAAKLLQNEEIQQLLHAKSAHAKLAEDIKEEEYFNKLERREAVENKLLSTFAIPTTAVMCRECKYIAVGQSDLCKERRHPIKIVQANKRFFKCKDCGQRTMSLDRLPKRSCTNCKSSSWIPTSVGKERAGPKLDSEVLTIRGDEEKFLGSSSSKLFLNL